MTTHQYTVALAPTPAQCAALQQLSWQSGLVRVLAHDQARVLADDCQDVSIAGMLASDQDHARRGAAAEARALQRVASTRGAPHGLLVAAIRAGRADHAQQRSPRRIDLPHDVAASTGQITPAGAQSVLIAGVTGGVGLEAADLPQWAAQAWIQAAAMARSLPTRIATGAHITGAQVRPVDGVDLDHWVLTLTLDWIAEPTGWQLQRAQAEAQQALRGLLELLDEKDTP